MIGGVEQRRGFREWLKAAASLAETAFERAADLVEGYRLGGDVYAAGDGYGMFVALDHRHIYGERPAVPVRSLYPKRSPVRLHPDLIREESCKLSRSSRYAGGADKDQKPSHGVLAKLRQGSVGRLAVSGER